MTPPDAPIGARPLSAARPANGKIGTRLRKSDKKATGALVDAQEESCPRGYDSRSCRRSTKFNNPWRSFILMATTSLVPVPILNSIGYEGRIVLACNGVQRASNAAWPSTSIDATARNVKAPTPKTLEPASLKRDGADGKNARA
jgi:hypothetical protein